VEEGDIVFAYVGGNIVALVGLVLGSYEFNDGNKVGNPGGDIGYAHQRKVK